MPSQEVSTQISVNAGTGIDVASSSQIEAAAEEAGLDAPTTAAIVDDDEQAQLKVGVLAVAALALVSVAFTRDLPHIRPSPKAKATPAATAA